ncbi:MAG: PQQ-like beta-propeller repeat protein [Kiritimatiellae bacterium]|nr:PQQ-like beta-propeller repeat protein [Kiritimatiellia bacterium]
MKPAWARCPMIVVALGLPILFQSGTRAEWPRFRGPNGNGIVEDKTFDPKGVETGQIEWTVTVGKGYSALSVVGGTGVTLGNDGERDHVVALDIATGREIWRHSYPAKPGSYPGPRASPWIESDRVYTLGYWGDAACLDLKTGRLVWSRNVAKEIGADVGRWGLAGSPVIVGEVVYLNVGRSGCALDKATGRMLWNGGGGTTGYSTPVPFQRRGRLHLALFGAKAFLIVDASNGKVVMEHPWETSWDVNAADPEPVAENRWFISSGYDKGCALLDVSGPRPREVWRNKTIASHFSSVVLLEGHIYGCDGNTGRGDLVCVRAADGQEVWRQKMGFGSVILINRCLVHFNEKGDITVVEASPAGYRPLARRERVVTDGKIWTAPVWSGGRLFMRSDRGTITSLRVSR